MTTKPKRLPLRKPLTVKEILAEIRVREAANRKSMRGASDGGFKLARVAHEHTADELASILEWAEGRVK